VTWYASATIDTHTHTHTGTAPLPAHGPRAKSYNQPIEDARGPKTALWSIKQMLPIVGMECVLDVAVVFQQSM
jgi:hypothetical protein